VRVYYSNTTGDLYWAKWIHPGEEANINFKYRILWPEEKTNIYVV
jgi:hypothetical protein